MAQCTQPSGGLEGMAVLVTGGGTGIGRACAERLAAHGGSVRWIAADVTREEDVRAAVARALEPTGRLDGCVANAGGGGGIGPYHVQEVEEFLRVLHLNVLGTMLCIKHTVTHLIEAGGGSFVGMSSLAGHVTHPYFGAYTAGKAGIEAMIRNAADEYGHKGVRFNAIRPGFIATEIMVHIPRESATYRSYVENTPMAGVGEPEDVAHLARFLIGPGSRWITGEAINVDGGHSLRRGPSFAEFAEAVYGRGVLDGEPPERRG
jgi:NAD(P)-dependent dehydrogenase (short-subunit alcohol dehydrogenase family)